MAGTGQAPIIQLDVVDAAPAADAFAEPAAGSAADDSSVVDEAAEEVVADESAEDQADKAKADEEAKKVADEEDLVEEEETPDQKAEREAQEAADAAAEEEDNSPKGAEARKEQLNREIRDLVARKNQLRDEVATTNAKVYQPQTAEELVEAGVDPTEARVQAMEQRQQMQEFNNHVADVNANLNIEALQVMADFPVFNPKAPEFNEQLSATARSIYESAAKMEVDPQTGLTINVSALPYNIYKSIAESFALGSTGGKVDGQRSAEKMLANAEPQSSAKKPSAPKKTDDFLAGLTKGLKIQAK